MELDGQTPCFVALWWALLVSLLPSAAHSQSCSVVGFPLVRSRAPALSATGGLAEDVGRRGSVSLVLTPSGRTLEVPTRDLEIAGQPDEPTCTDLEAWGRSILASPPLAVASGVRLRISGPGPSPALQVVSATLGRTSGLELAIGVSPRDPRGRFRATRLVDLASSSGALAGIVGTFCTLKGKFWTHPLGTVVVEGVLEVEAGAPSLRARDRSSIAWTSGGRVWIGEPDSPASPVVPDDQVRRGLSVRRGSGGDPAVRSMLGGLGRLVRSGDPDAWRSFAGRQFGHRFYSRWTRRPQSVIGIDEDGTEVFFLVQGSSRLGAPALSLPQLAWVARGLGAHDAVFADGGQGAQLWVRVGAGRLFPVGSTGRATSTAILVVPAQEPPPDQRSPHSQSTHAEN